VVMRISIGRRSEYRRRSRAQNVQEAPGYGEQSGLAEKADNG
jgi:hypothetical protein